MKNDGNSLLDRQSLPNTVVKTHTRTVCVKMTDNGQLVFGGYAMRQQYSNVSKVARSLVNQLLDRDIKIVLAESCTAGMAVAMLGTVPGVSAALCGASVTYRQATKTDWLGIPAALIDECSAESEIVTVAMAKNVLRNTPEAQLAAAITGHLGPGVAEPIDGKVYVAIANRNSPLTANATRHTLSTDSRSSRQFEAAGILLNQIFDVVTKLGEFDSGNDR